MKISVIMPAYNSEKTIKESINSVISQEGAEIELIVVNDGSTDRTADILAEFGGKITAVTIPNRGAAGARNTALEMASGEYVMFVDADDSLAEGAIAEIAKRADETNTDIVRFEYVMVTPDGKRILAENRFENEELIKDDGFKSKIYPQFIGGIRMNSLCTVAARKSLFEGLRFREDMQTAEDAYLLTDVYTKAESVLVIPKELYVYNRHGDSLTGAGLSVLKKYICNFRLSRKLAGMLPVWGMATLYWYIKVYLRPIVLTLDKLKRINALK